VGALDARQLQGPRFRPVGGDPQGFGRVRGVEGKQEVEIGYLFLRRFWGRGLTTEAVIAARDYGFYTLGYRRLVSIIDPANLASRRVAEKTGFTLEKKVEKWGKVVCVYAIGNEG
jgi:ribosomal-protein-alanine N-acetyltransferase